MFLGSCWLACQTLWGCESSPAAQRTWNEGTGARAQHSCSSFRKWIASFSSILLSTFCAMPAPVEYLLLTGFQQHEFAHQGGLVQIGHVAVMQWRQFCTTVCLREVLFQQSVTPVLWVEHNWNSTHQFCCFKSTVDEIYQSLDSFVWTMGFSDIFVCLLLSTRTLWLCELNSIPRHHLSQRPAVLVNLYKNTGKVNIVP